MLSVWIIYEGQTTQILCKFTPLIIACDCQIKKLSAYFSSAAETVFYIYFNEVSGVSENFKTICMSTNTQSISWHSPFNSPLSCKFWMAGQGAPVRLDGRAEDRSWLPDDHHAHEAEAPSGHCRQTLSTQLAIPRQMGGWSVLRLGSRESSISRDYLTM